MYGMVTKVSVVKRLRVCLCCVLRASVSSCSLYSTHCYYILELSWQTTIRKVNEKNYDPFLTVTRKYHSIVYIRCRLFEKFRLLTNTGQGLRSRKVFLPWKSGIFCHVL